MNINKVKSKATLESVTESPPSPNGSRPYIPQLGTPPTATHNFVATNIFFSDTILVE
jgi:hypothetical protein